MNQEKLDFITQKLIPLVESLPADATGKWGKMNGQQTVEHVAAFFYVSAGKIKFDLITPAEHLPKFKEFLLSDKEFRENTKAPSSVLSEEPMAVRHSSMTGSVEELKKGIAAFVDHFKDDPNKTTLHPVFGDLNFEEWVLLHYKHVRHHLKQFNLMT